MSSAYPSPYRSPQWSPPSISIPPPILSLCSSMFCFGGQNPHHRSIAQPPPPTSKSSPYPSPHRSPPQPPPFISSPPLILSPCGSIFCFGGQNPRHRSIAQPLPPTFKSSAYPLPHMSQPRPLLFISTLPLILSHAARFSVLGVKIPHFHPISLAYFLVWSMPAPTTLYLSLTVL